MADVTSQYFDPNTENDTSWLGQLPRLALASRPAPAPQPNLFTSALSSGFHEALGNVGGAVQAGGAAFGLPGVASFGQNLAASQHQAAIAAGRQDLEESPWSIKGMAYGLTKAIPTLAGALAPMLIPGVGPVGEALGAGAVMFPQAVGENVQAAQGASQGELSQGDAVKSLLLGLPEAAAMAYMPAKVGGIIERGAAGGLARRALTGGATLGAYQAGLSAAQTAVTQQAFTPDMPLADRARQVVDSALGGGFQGAVFGGLTSALRKARAPVTDQPAQSVATPTLANAVDAVVRPQIPQIPPTERMSPLPKSAGDYSGMPNDQLTALAEPLAARGENRTGAENIVHGLLQEELARRTPPGLASGEGTLFTPEEMAARAPQVEATRNLALEATGAARSRPGLAGSALSVPGGDNNSFFRNFNAASEPELINAIRAKVEGTKSSEVPGWLKTLADRYAVPIGEDGNDPAARITELYKQQDLLEKERDAAVTAGKPQAIRAANRPLIDVGSKIIEARRILGLHIEAQKLMDTQIPQAPEPVPAPVTDPTGQLNIPGMGERGTPAPGEAPAAGETSIPAGQRELFTSQETGAAQLARQEAVQKFQSQFLDRATSTPRARAALEPIVQSFDAVSEPELINALKAHIADADQNNNGALLPGVKKLAARYALDDPVGLDRVRQEMQAYQDQHDSLIGQAGDALRKKADGQASVFYNRAQEVKNTKIAPLENLLELHAQSDDLTRSFPPYEVPDRVPEALAGQWKALQAIKEGVSPSLAKTADNAQKAIETGVPKAREISQLALNLFSSAMRPRFVRDIVKGAKPEPRPEPAPAPTPEPAPTPAPTPAAPAKRSRAAKGKAAEPAPTTVPPEPEPDLSAKADADAQTVAAAVKELGSNTAVPPRDKPTDTISRAGGDAFRAGAPIEENPYDARTDTVAANAWLDGWDAAEAHARVDAQEALRRQNTVRPPRSLPGEMAKVRLAALDQTKLSPERLTEVQDALRSKDPKVWSSVENKIAITEFYTGRPAESAITFGKRAVPPGPPVGQPEPVRSWAEPAAYAVHGDVVYADANHAVVRGFNAFGDSVYLAVDRVLNSRTTRNIRGESQQPAWLNQETRGKLVAQADQHRDREAKGFAQNFDGPFKGATDQAVGTPSADPRIVKLTSGILKQLGIGARVLIVDARDVQGAAGDKLGLYGPYEAARTAGTDQTDFGHKRMFGPGGKDFYIYLKSGLKDALAVETLTHELGHIVENTVLRNAPQHVQDAIDAEFNRFYKNNVGAKSQDLIRATRNREMTQELLDQLGPQTEMGQSSRAYFLKKSEWVADGVSRWASTAEKPRTLVEKFFAEVGRRLRDLLAAVTGNRFAPPSELAKFLDSLGPDSMQNQMVLDRGGQKIPTTEPRGPESVQGMNLMAESAVSNFDALHAKASDMVERMGKDAPVNVRKSLLIGETLGGIAKIAGKFLKTGQLWVDTHRQREAITDLKNKPDIKSLRVVDELNPEVRDLVNKHLALLRNPWHLDGRKPWSSYTDLHDLPNAADLIAQHQRLVSDYSNLQRAGGREGLEAILGMNQTKAYQDITSILYRHGGVLAEQGVQLASHGVNPDHTYQMNSALHDSPEGTRAFYRGHAGTMLDGMQAHVDQAKAAAAAFMQTDPKAYRDAIGGLASTQSIIKLANDRLNMADRGTYSPLSHGKGDYFVSARLAVGDDKRPTQQAVGALQAALESKGFKAGVFYDTDSNSFFTRVETKAQMRDLRDVLAGLETAGHLGEIRNGHPDNLNTMIGLGPRYMKAMAEAVESAMRGAEIIDPDAMSEVKAQMVARWMDLLPQDSGLKNLQPTRYVSGYHEDLIKASKDYALNSSRSSTYTSMQDQFAQMREAVRDEVQANKSSAGPEALIGNDAANEFWRREAEQAWHVPGSIADGLRTVTHILRIGFNPVYTLTMLSQIPTLLHGELAKKHGYLKSAAAIARAMGPAFGILKAVLSGADRVTAGFRDEDLRRGGVSDLHREVVMNLSNRGSLSTFTGHMSNLGEGHSSSTLHKISTWGSALGIYSEMIPRVVGALAAADLYDKRPIQGISRADYVKNIVNESQFVWGPGESSRLTSKKGPLGAWTPISLQFMAFQTRMVEKITTEVHALAGKDGPQAQKEAGIFLASHLVAITALAGTLGLPAAAWFAGAADKLAAQLTGRDDIDVEGMYRNWLSATFGPEVGDVIAKGLPRAIGIDESHLGDQNLIPGTSVMRDKHKFEDALKDWAVSMLGPAIGEVGDIVLGARDVSNGDYLHGLIRVAPEGLKGAAEGYYLSKYGYMDSKGRRYAVQPRTMDIIFASLGLDPANLAQQKEAAQIRSGLMAQRQYREQNITSHLMRALSNPESADLGTWLRASGQYMREHPALGGPLQAMQSNYSKFLTDNAYAKVLNVIPGTKPLDYGLGMPRFLTPQGPPQ